MSRTNNEDLSKLAQAISLGEIGAVARGISLLERGGPDASELSQILPAPREQCFVIGITGPPGSGKSTLIAALGRAYRARDDKVAVLAIDPSSSLHRGALLGDRIRMGELGLDADVFIRSMASRGALGGLSGATQAAVKLLGAARFDEVLLETVGVGQSESDVVEVSDCVVLLHAPNTGDEVQAIKSGLSELADIHVLNKADLPGATRTQRLLEEELHYRVGSSDPVRLVRTVANKGEGIDELLVALDEQRLKLVAVRELKVQARGRREIRSQLTALVDQAIASSPELVSKVAAGALDAPDAAQQLLQGLIEGQSPDSARISESSPARRDTAQS